MVRDLRYAFRSLSKSPGFVAVATVCLGLALNTTTFAILDAMRHPSLPVKDPERIFEVQMWGRGAGSDAPVFERYAVLREGRFYDDISFYQWTPLISVQAGENVAEQNVAWVASNFFQLLGTKPEQGRLLGPGTPESAAVVSHDLWERLLGGRPLVGLTVWVNESEYQVVGVLPADMTFPGSEIWVPVPASTERVGARWGGIGGLTPVVKVKRGWTQEAVKAQLATLAKRLTLTYGSGPVPYAFTLKSIVRDPMGLRQIHFAMAGAAFAILLIACANLAGLMLVRGVVKRRELALRMALGAGRGTVAWQLLLESGVIVAVGAAVGMLLTLWAIPVLGSQMPQSVRALGIVRPHPSWRVFLACLSAAAGTLLIFGLWPAVRSSDVDVSEPLKDASASATGRRRWRYSPLVIGQVALSLVLLMGAVLLSRAVARLGQSMLGYDREGLLEAWVWRGRPYEVRNDSAEQAYDDLLTRLHSIPEVRSVAAWSGRGGPGAVMSEFYDGANGLLPRASMHRVTGEFLGTLGIPILQGRDFLPGDERTGAVIVDQVAANALWPDGRAVGRMVKLSGPQVNTPWYPVVGVARRAMPMGVSADAYLPPAGTVYVAWRPRGRIANWGLAIRTSRYDARAALAVRHAIREASPSGGRALWVMQWLPYFDIEMRARRFLVSLFGAFGAFALALAAIGLYGVVSYSVSQRLREFAVRIAVGAPSRDVLKLMAHDAAVMILAGTGVGAFVAMWGSTLLGDWLYNVYHTDALSLVLAELMLLAAALVACLQPALRAMRADPIEILRAI